MRAFLGILLVGVMLGAGCLSTEAASVRDVQGCDLEPVEYGERGARFAGGATIEFQDLEGGFYGIVMDDGRHLDPMNLCDAFKRDGLRVHVEGVLREGVGGFHMWGDHVELDAISAL